MRHSQHHRPERATALKLMALALLMVVASVVSFAQSDSSVRYPLPREGEPQSPLHLSTPSNITTDVEYDPKSHSYTVVKRVGTLVLSRTYMSFDEYQDWRMQQLMDKYWHNKTQQSVLEGGEGFLSKIPGYNEVSRRIEELLGTKPTIEINPTGSVDLTFQLTHQYRDNPQVDPRRRNHITPGFETNIQLNLNAKIGDLVGFDLNLNTQATFDFENLIKLKYEGKEDDILQLLEVANVSFPLSTTLIHGSQQLMGVHSKMKFGKLTVDAVVSQKETSTENMRVQGGSSTQEFEIRADEYEENRHYFISQYFYDNYNKAMSTLPVVNSNIKIIRMEVWRTNVGATVTNNRNLLALTDLAEYNPSNSAISRGSSVMPHSYLSNNLMTMLDVGSIRNVNNVTNYMQLMGLVSGTDYEKIESARLLTPSEYTYNSRLGFISLNQPLSNDQMLAVAFQYQVIGDTTVYQVGELTTDGINDPNVLVVKLIKGTSVNPRSPLWKLMMKNVYFLKSTQLSRENFRLNILYEDPQGGVGIGFFTDGPRSGIPLIEVFGLDRMDASMNYNYADGVFDWFDSAAYKGGIIQSTTGRIYFPYVEPFGKDLRAILNDNTFADNYCFDSLYTMTQTLARQYADKNKFYLEGYYTSSVSGEISLGFSVTQGSVTVTAGGVPLIENVDYTVDYTMGTVRIINESILASGTPISVSSENNSFSMLTKRMLGLHINYEFNPDFNLGATAMNLYEKPLTQKNNFGEEPTSNSIYGFDLNFRHEVPFITRLVDMLPGIQTKAPSTLSLQAEFAHFLPGLTSVGGSENKVSYVDDFEGAESSIDLKGVDYWTLASTPQDHSGTSPLFPEAAPGTGRAYGFNRALVAWYTIDNTFYSTSESPSNITEDDRSRPYARPIYSREVFPNRTLASSDYQSVYEFNLAYYPAERGPYNYDAAPSAFSAGLSSNGLLNNPSSRWGGIMRSLQYTDFETQNIETLEFWLMDPFMDPETGEHDATRTGGKLYINLGDISEDILRDGRKFFENGLPGGTTAEDFEAAPIDTTIWGRVPKMQSIVNAFDNRESARMYQDVGLDGLGSTNGIDDEQSFFADYINSIAVLFGTQSEAYQKAIADPSADDFHYYRGSDYDRADVKITDRYKYYSRPEGNSAVNNGSSESYATAATNYPNVEDINRDNTLSEAENYYQYELQLDPAHMVIGQNHIVDIQEADNVVLPNGAVAPRCRWYQFSIPIREPDKTVGTINGFQSIRFMRMFLRDFSEPVILRFATLELVYGTWRKYTEDLLSPGEYPPGGINTSLNLSTVNIEENGSRAPVPYVLPPGIDRESLQNSSAGYIALNEQSLSLDINDLATGDARAVYRNMQYDLRDYGKLKMFVHAEKKNIADNLNDDDLQLFVRIGSDYTQNYYEYQMPLKLTSIEQTTYTREEVWPYENNVEIDLQRLVDIKTNRNRQIRSGVAVPVGYPYSETVGNRTYSVMGSPNLGKVKVIMIGVRNPRASGSTVQTPRSAIIWINELRLSDYNNNGGVAAMVLARTNLADIGNLSIYGSYTASNFGNLEDNLSNLEDNSIFSFQSTLNLELDKFMPQEWGWHIPFYLDYHSQTGIPKHNPLDPDVKLRDDIATYNTAAERDSIRRMAQERKSSTNITLTNVHKDRTGQNQLKPHFYDLANFNLSYAYTGERASDEDISRFAKDQHKGGLTYNYNFPEPGQFRPFAKSKAFQKKEWLFIKDFNLYYQPKSVSFSTEVFRNFEETLLRNKSNALVIMRPMYFKQFTWRRDYGVQYDLARSFHIQYDASAYATIDEPMGRIDHSSAVDSVLRSVIGGGTMQNYRQNIQANWDVPVKKLPYLDFLQMPLTYRVTYEYQGVPASLRSQGATLNTTTNATGSLTASLQNLYSKVPILKKANARKPALPQRRPDDKSKTKDKPKVDPKREMKTPESDAVADSLRRVAMKEKLQEAAYFGLRLLTSVKNVNLQYNSSSSSRVAGYMGEPAIFGLDPSTQWTPGIGYVLGFTDGIADRLLSYDLLSHDTLMNNPHNNVYNRIIAFQADMEPLRDMKISLTATENYSSNEEYYFKYNSAVGEVVGPLSRSFTGSYTATTWSFRTSLRNADDLFSEFLSSRIEVAQRLADINPSPYTEFMVYDSLSGLSFPGGYSPNSQTVLLTAFLATYLGNDAKKQSFSPFLKLPLPNWNINYTGLNKVEWLRQWFTNITLSHRYSSTYSVGNFYTDAALSGLSDDYDYGHETLTNITGDYIAPVSMEGVQITEQFNPLLRLSLSTVNNLQLNFSYQRGRTLQLSFANNQLTENTRSGLTVGAGYRFKDVKINIKTSEKTYNFKSDLVLQLNITYNDNMVVIRKISQNLRQITSGAVVWMGELSAEYTLSKNLSLRAFFQTNINKPRMTNTYANTTNKGGLMLRFSF